MKNDRTLPTTGAAHAVDERDSVTRASTEPVAPSRPRRVGRYQLVRTLGAGGMGVVWEAIDPELERKVAIKLVHEPRRSRLADRLLREAQALAQLHHPNVVAVYDVGIDDGELYIVMQLVNGTTLDRALTARASTPREIVGLLLQAGRGLAAAHAANIVHRDFKPSNILVDDRGIVRVSDFGLARMTEAASASGEGAATSLDVSITHGKLIGTPAYMAPEQVLRGPVTQATDQFSFCITLWESLIGERPFPANDLASMREAVMAGRYAPIPSHLPRRVRAVLARGLAVDPARRFRSMNELLDRLEPTRSGRWIAGGLAVAVASAASVLAIATVRHIDPCGQIDASLLAGTWDAPTSQRMHAAFLRSTNGNAEDAYQRTSAVLDRYANQWVAMRRQACEATEVRHEQSPTLLDLRIQCLDARAGELAAVGRVLAETTESRGVERALDTALNKLSALDGCADRGALLSVVPLPADPTRRAFARRLEAQVADADARGDVGQIAPALVSATRAVDEIRALDYPPLLGRALLVRASLETQGGDITKAAALLYEAAEAAARGKDDHMVARTWLALVIAFNKQRKLDAALAVEPFMRTAIARIGTDARLAAEFDWAFGTTLRSQGKIADAERRLRAALGQLPSTEHVRRGDFLQSYALVLRALGKQAEARAALEESVAIFEQTFGPQSYRLATGLYNLSRQDMLEHRCADAKLAAERSLAIYARILGPDNPDLILDYASMGDLASYCLKDPALARRSYQKSLALIGTSPDDERQRTNILGTYGRGLLELGLATEAQPLLSQALARAEQGNDRVVLVLQLRFLGEAWLILGQPGKARPLIERAVKLYEEMQSMADLAWVLTDLGQALVDLHQPAQAIEPLTRAVAVAQKSAVDELPTTQLQLARALWDSGRDRLKARALATDAEARAKSDPQRAEIAAWLRGHP
jgi:eukaryotic-like serine/threonine-protein kinase